MHYTSTSTGVCRGNTLTHFSNNFGNNSKYQEVSSVSVGKYSTIGEEVYITFSVSPPTGFTLNVEKAITFTQDFNSTFAVLSTINAITQKTTGLLFEFGSISSISTSVATVRFTTGLANRLGFYDSETYTVNGTINSDFNPITNEPQYFVFSYNGEEVAVIYPNGNVNYTTNYSVYRKASYDTPTVLLTDHNNKLVYIPATFTVDFVDPEEVNFREIGVSRVLDEQTHKVLTPSSQTYGIRDIYINDSQICNGNETLSTIDIYLYTIQTSPQYYINDEFKLTTVSAESISTSPKCIILPDKTTYYAIPVTASLVIEQLPEVISFLSTYEFKPYLCPVAVTGTTSTINALNTTSYRVLNHIASKGLLSSHHITDLTTVNTYLSTSVINNTITITNTVTRMLAFVTQSPMWNKLLPIPEIFDIKNSYTTSYNLPLGNTYPLYYTIRFYQDEMEFTSSDNRRIKWRKNLGTLAFKPVQIYSHSTDGEIIRTLEAAEYSTTFIFRTTNKI